MTLGGCGRRVEDRCGRVPVEVESKAGLMTYTVVAVVQYLFNLVVIRPNSTIHDKHIDDNHRQCDEMK